MDVLGLIPARAGSKGIPGKNIKDLKGKPLITYTFDSALVSRSLTRLILSTDSEDIAKVGKDYGVDVPFIRPIEFASDHSPALDYIFHCLEFLEINEGYQPDVIVLLQPTCPLRITEDIDNCINLLVKSDADSVVSVSELPAKYHPSWQFKVSDDGILSSFLGETWNNLPTARQNIDTTYSRNGAVYAFRNKMFQSMKNIYGKKVLAYKMPEERSINIDDMDDWVKAESIITKR
jgi:CMP-N,N'-diacetyllegionaminic acid synthase